MCARQAAGMTASLFVTGTPAASAARLGSHHPGRPASAVSHAVAKPVVDGLEASVCGLLVTARAADDWTTDRDASRCEECARIAG